MQLDTLMDENDGSWCAKVFLRLKFPFAFSVPAAMAADAKIKDVPIFSCP